MNHLQLFENFKEKDLAYHVGSLKGKSETLTERGFKIGITGQMGTGYYFFGDLTDAKKFSKKQGSDIWVIDFSKYKLLKPKDVNEFYDGLVKPLTGFCKDLDLKDFEDKEVLKTLKDAADFYREYKVKISNKALIKIVREFVTDLIDKKSKTNEMLNTRILKHVGYEGVDVRFTDLDDFSVGSIIFDLKPKTYHLFQK